MPDWRKDLRAALAPLRLDPHEEASVVEELSQDLQDRYEDMLLRGVSEHDAYASLRRELSDEALATVLKRNVHRASTSLVPADQRKQSPLSNVWYDLRHGARLLGKSPGFALIAILSLALGIGANTTIFQLLDAVRLRTLPVDSPRELAQVHISSKNRWGDFYSPYADLTYGVWDQLRQQQQAFTAIAAWSPFRFNLGIGGEARYADTLMVSGDFFRVLGIQPAMGRLITPTDDYRGCGAQGAVLSYAFWQREFGGGTDVVGRSLTLNGHAFQVMGVTPPSFFGVVVGNRFDVAVPLCSEPLFTPKTSLMERPSSWWLGVIGRLKPGWTMERATGHLEAISPAMFAATVPEDFDAPERKQWLEFRLSAVPLATGVSTLRRTYEDPLYLLLALSGVVLLIACANLANLLLARASGRQREMALRLALGASRARLVRQLLAESLLLAVLGTAAGAVLAQFLSRILVAFLGTAQNRVFVELTPDWRLLGFATMLALITCVLFGLMPAIQASQTEPGVALKSNTRGSTPGRARFRARRLLVIAQVALSLVLVVGAFLFIRSFRNLADLNAGFVQDQVLVTQVDWAALHLNADRVPEFQRELLERLRALGEVSAAAELQIVPMSHSGWDDNVDVPDGPQRVDVNFNRVSPGYFKTMQIPLLAGRDFADEDTPASPVVAVVNQELVRKLFGGANPVGRIFKNSGDAKKSCRIIGVVADTKFYDMREQPVPIAWLSYTQSIGPEPQTNVMIRSQQPLLPLLASLKHALAEINPALVVEFAPLKTQIRDSLLRERLMAMLSGSFGALATILAMVGLYGVISYVVAQRRTEIGVRMALGASRRDIVRMVLGEVGVLLGIGLSVGAALTLVFGSAASSMLYGLKTYDPLTLAAATVAMAAVAAIASVIPAQRAATVDPMVALREE